MSTAPRESIWPGWVIVDGDQPCNGCGDCCIQHPCTLAGGHDPCIALRHRDGRYWCGLVELGITGVKDALLVGHGCGAYVIPREFWERKERLAREREGQLRLLEWT